MQYAYVVERLMYSAYVVRRQIQNPVKRPRWSFLQK